VTLTFRKARETDLPAIVGMLADDDLGRTREGPLEEGSRYHRAFHALDADPNQFLCVAETGGEVVGTLQLTFIPGLSRGGATRGQIEAVRVARGHRDAGIGRAMIGWAIAECRARSCALVQLTTDRARPDAHRFYEGLGFEASHLGYKMDLGDPG